MLYKERAFGVKDDMRLTLRSANANDTAAFLVLLQELCTDTPFSPYTLEECIDEQKLAQKIESFALQENCMLLLAEENGKLIGYASIRPLADLQKTKHRGLYEGAVLKHYWGYGVGSLLTKELFAYAEQMQFSQFEADVFADNRRAIEMYTQLGFEEWARIKKAYKTEHDFIDQLHLGKEI